MKDYMIIYKKGTIDDTYIHKVLNISKKKEQYQKSKNDLFAVVIVLKYLLDEKDFMMFINELEVIINELIETTRILEERQLYKYMGFPENWKEIKKCQNFYK